MGSVCFSSSHRLSDCRGRVPWEGGRGAVGGGRVGEGEGDKGQKEGRGGGGEEVEGGPITSLQSTDGSLTPTELSAGQEKERETSRKKDWEEEKKDERPLFFFIFLFSPSLTFCCRPRKTFLHLPPSPRYISNSRPSDSLFATRFLSLITFRLVARRALFLLPI